MNPELKELKNGVKLVVKPLRGLKSVTVEVGVKIGSKYEGIKEHGLTHFLEHMAFKGTSKRPTAAIINKEIDSRGASYNAGTTQESTIYYVTTVKENLAWAIEILADILNDPRLEATEAIKEKEVTMEEIKMYQDNPRMGLTDEFYGFVLGKSPIGCWDIAGTVAEVSKYGRKDLVFYRQKMLNTKEMVVVVTGNVPEMKEVENIVEKYFGNIKTGNETLPTVKIEFNKEMTKEIIKSTEQAHFCLGVKGIARGDRKKYALRLLEIILAGNSSSRLFQEIRENRGWAYYVDSIGQSFTETGLVGIQTGVRKEKLEETIDLTKKILIDLHSSIDESELSRAKQYLRGRLGLAMDHSEFWSEYLDQKLLLEGEIGDLNTYMEMIEMVKLGELQDLSKELFTKDKFRTLMIRG
jgi:predicted Zn-dependent peptidase